MARRARIVIAGLPHLVMQRGAGGRQVFYTAADSQGYRARLAESCAAAAVTCLAYCLMPDHVRLVLVPSDEDGLRRALADLHRRHARELRRRESLVGPLWQGRFASCVMAEGLAAEAAHLVELTPVREGWCSRPERWRWSSARAHLAGEEDPLVEVAPLLARMPDWAGFLRTTMPAARRTLFERHLGTGRPLGPTSFLDTLEHRLGLGLRPRKRGPRPKVPGTARP